MPLFKNVFNLLSGFDSDDEPESKYLNSFNEFIKSDHYEQVRELLGDQLRCLDTTLASWLQAARRQDNFNSVELKQFLDQKPFAVLSFPKHSSAVIVQNSLEGKPSVAYFLETRPTDYTHLSTHKCEIPGEQEKGARFASGIMKSRMPVPTAAVFVKEPGLDDRVRDYILGLFDRECPFPREDREFRAPSYVLEGILPLLDGGNVPFSAVEVTASFEPDYRYRDLRDWRSVHYTTLKHVVRLLIRLTAVVPVGSDSSHEVHARSAYKHVIMFYLLWLMEMEWDKANLDVRQEMIQKIAGKLTKLQECHGCSLACVEHIHDRVTEAQTRLEKANEVATEREAALHVLPQTAIVADQPFFDCRLLEEGDFKPTTLSADTAELGLFANKFYHQPTDRASLVELTASGRWALQKPQASLPECLEYAMLMMEKQYLRLSWSTDDFFSTGANARVPSCTLWWGTSSGDEVAKDIHDFITTYRLVHKQVHAGRKVTVEAHSVFVLVQVTAAITLYSMAMSEISLVKQFCIPLAASCIDNLVLPGAEYRAIAACVAKHIREFGSLGNKYLFQHSTKCEDMIDFAVQYTRGNFQHSINLRSILISERTDMARREAAYHAEVKRLGQVAANLRAQIARVQESYNNCEAHMGNHYRTMLNDLGLQLRRAEQAPPPEIFPIPQDTEQAERVIFFLFMPKLLRVLSAAIIDTQFYLSTTGASDDNLTEEKFEMDWWDHFSNNSKTGITDTVERPSSGVCLMSDKKGLAHSHLRNTLTIHYADMALRHYGVLPLVVNSIFGAYMYTDANASVFYKSLSGAEKLNHLVAPGVPENEVLCTQCNTPEWMDSTATYVYFGELRSCPNLQLRRVLLVLKYNRLPVTHPAVRTMIQQTLRQIGPLKADRPGHRLWYSDLADDCFCAEFSNAVSVCLDAVEEKPREHAAILVYIDVAAWLASFRSAESDLLLLRRIYSIVGVWERRLVQQNDNTGGDFALQDQIRSELCRYRTYMALAIASIPAHAVTDKDDADLLIAMAGVSNANVCFVPTNVAYANSFMLELRSVVCARADRLPKLLVGSLDAVLTFTNYRDLVSVSAVAWTRNDSSFCFQGTMPDGVVVEVNALTGKVLVGGFPVGCLPQAITRDPLYMKAFGSSNFLVRVSEDRLWFATDDPVDNCSYRFGVNNSGSLLVEEIPKENPSLSNGLKLVSQSMVKDLPMYFQEDFIHWYNDSRKLILLRDQTTFRFRGTRSDDGTHFDKLHNYVLQLHPNGSACRVTCFHIPSMTTASDVAGVFAGRHGWSSDSPVRVEKLIPPSDKSLRATMAVLRHFEKVDNILFFSGTDDNAEMHRLQFIRLGLRFSYSAKLGFVSEEFGSYKLANEQLLAHTLSGFKEYLVLRALDPLENLQAATIIIARDCTFSRSGKTLSTVRTKDTFVRWEVDRQGQLNSFDMNSRLSLSCAYVATSTMLKDLCAERTGIERAMELLRECYSSAPYDAVCSRHIVNLCKIAVSLEKCVHGAFTLQLLTRYYRKRSMELVFMYQKEKEEKEEEDPLKMLLCQNYWKAKLARKGHNCFLSAEEEVFLFGKHFEDYGPRDVRPALISRTRLSGEIIPTVRSATATRINPTMFHNAPFFTRTADMEVLSADGLAFSWAPELARCWMSIYELVYAGRNDPNRRRTATVDIFWLALEVIVSDLDPPIKAGKPIPNEQCPLQLVAVLQLMCSHCDDLEFPAMPFPCDRGDASLVPCSDMNMALREGEISSLVEKVCPLSPNYPSSRGVSHRDYQSAVSNADRLARNRLNSQVRCVWTSCLHVGQLLDSSHCPTQEALYTDLVGDVPVNFSGQLGNIPGLLENSGIPASVFIVIEPSYRRASRAIGLKRFLDAVTKSAINVLPSLKAHPSDADEPLHQINYPIVGVEPLCEVSYSIPDYIVVVEEVCQRLRDCFRPALAGDRPLVSTGGTGNALGRLLPATFFTTKLGKELYCELEKSWDKNTADVSQLGFVLTAIESATESRDDVFCKLQERLKSALETCFRQVRSAISTFPLLTKGGLVHSLNYNTMCVQQSTRAQIYQTYGGDEAKHLNVYLDAPSRQQLAVSIRSLLVMHVLHVKVLRLLCMARKMAGQPEKLAVLTEAAMVVELQSLRDMSRFSCSGLGGTRCRLLFEYEQCVTIRPVQHEVINAMLESPGHVHQFNMGEGKSKVLVPIEACELADGKRLVRVNVLDSLRQETYTYLHKVLGGLQGRRVYLLPFCRDVAITSSVIAILGKLVKECCHNGGVLIMTPEQRLSMHLKLLELAYNKETTLCQEFANLCYSVPIVELLDESDALLRPSYQLIYPVGVPYTLDFANERWLVAEAVFRHLNTDNELVTLLSDATVVVREHGAPPGHFASIRVIDKTLVMDKICSRLADLVINDPPGALVTLKEQTVECKTHLKRYVLNDNVDSEFVDMITPYFDTDKKLYGVVLSLRGLLAYGVLAHALSKRHRVEYGVNSHGKKRLAVPFTAKDSPSDRQEFGHPDVAIAATLLSYYHGGLDRAQVKATFELLLRAGRNDQESVYQCWYVLIASTMTAEDKIKLSRAGKIDIGNGAQLDSLCKYFSHNIEVINYYLNGVVFPHELRQFPDKLIANAWDLAWFNPTGDGGTVAVHGFSGTKDSRHTLPPCVKQAESIPKLMATDGKVLNFLLSPEYGNTFYSTVDQNSAAVLESIYQHYNNSDAADTDNDGGTIAPPPTPPTVLVDCGALLTGYSNAEVVNLVLIRLPGKFAGGIYFDTAGHLSVVDTCGRVSKFANSSILAKDCFTYLDDAHTRGTDLKFAPNARAIVTVGKDMPKDKGVQGAMRMRQLGVGQNIEWVGNREVSTKIAAFCKCQIGEITSAELMAWMLSNTIEAQETSMVGFARQGGVFGTKCAALQPLRTATPEAMELLTYLFKTKEVLELKKFYGGMLTLRLCHKVVKAHLHNVEMSVDSIWKKDCSVVSEDVRDGIEDSLRGIAEGLNEFALKYTRRRYMNSCNLDEEYECELESQPEEELQRQLPPPETATKEEVWDPECIFSETELHVRILPISQVFGVALSDVVKRGDLQFSKALVATQNFKSVVESANERDKADGYLRRPEIVLMRGDTVGNCKYILLSGAEGNRLLPLMWEKRGKLYNGCEVSFLHYPDLNSGMCISLPREQRVAVTAPQLFMQLRLFNGECCYNRDALPLLRCFTGHITMQDLSNVVDPHTEELDASTEKLYNHLRDLNILGTSGLMRMAPSAAIIEGLEIAGVKNDAVSQLLEMCWSSRGVRGNVQNIVTKLVEIRGGIHELEGSNLLRVLTGVEEADTF